MTISVERWVSLRFLPTVCHSSSISGGAVRAVRMSIGSIPIAVIYGDVAQLVERWTVNPCVVGSIPTISAMQGKRGLFKVIPL